MLCCNHLKNAIILINERTNYICLCRIPKKLGNKCYVTIHQVILISEYKNNQVLKGLLFQYFIKLQQS